MNKPYVKTFIYLKVVKEKYSDLNLGHILFICFCKKTEVKKKQVVGKIHLKHHMLTIIQKI